MTRSKKKPARFKNLAALISALAEGAINKEEINGYLDAVRMGIGLSKRDKALGIALEGAGNTKDGPAYWDGFRDGLVQGYEGARSDVASGTPLRSVTDLAAEAKAESETTKN